MSGFSQLYLASKSPRRSAILEQAGISFKIVLQDVEELYPDNLDLRKVPEYLAQLKANGADVSLQQQDVVLASDTIVLLNNEIIGKPANEDQAVETIMKLSGNCHEVISGVCLQSNEKTILFTDVTKVYFNTIDSNLAKKYVDECQPLDKAGAYAIQEWIGMIGINKIEGDYFNVVGLPINRVWRALQEW